MKLCFLLFLFLSIGAAAAENQVSTEDNQAVSDEELQIPEEKLFSLTKATDVRLILGYSTINKFEYKGNAVTESRSDSRFWETDKTGGAMMVGAEAIVFKDPALFSISAGAVFEFERNIDQNRLIFEGVGDSFQGKDSSTKFTLFNPFVNLYYDLNERFSLLGGFGFTFPIFHNSTINFRPSISYQGGLVFHFSEKISIDLLYRFQRFKMNETAEFDFFSGTEVTTRDGDAYAEGVALQVRTRL